MDQENTNKDKEVIREFGLTTWSVKNRTSVWILSLIIAMLGVYSYIEMPKESFPEIVIPTIYIGTSYPGNSPVDMENLITRPIEKELKAINGVKNITSSSIQDFSTILVEFNPEVEVSRALQDTKDAVDKAKSELPTDLDTDPNVMEINFSEFPIMYINLSGDFSIDELKDHAEYLEDEIEKLSEISKVDISGDLDREIIVSVDLFKMEARSVSFSDIENAIAGENVTMSGGDILAGDFRRSLRIAGEFASPRQIEDVIVKDENQNIVYVRDVAEVNDSYKDRTSYSRLDGEPVVTLGVVKRSGENLLAASDRIREILEKAENDRFPDGLKITISNDMSESTRMQVENLENSIITGVILVILVLMFFLGLRNALFVGVAIPMSMFLSFLILNALGITLNFMVLFGLVLALGMLVDNGIVVIENIYRKLEEGLTPSHAARQGVGEVALPIITSTGTTVSAFLPLAFWGGMMGEFMKYLPICVIVVLSSSLFVAFVINPVLAAMFITKEKKEPNKKRLLIMAAVLAVIAIAGYIVADSYTFANLVMFVAIFIPLNLFLLRPATYWFQNNLLVKLENFYFDSMRFFMAGNRPIAVFSGTIILFFVSIALFGIRAPKVLFFPENEPNYINIFIEQPIGTDIESTNEFARVVENEVREMMEPYDYMVESVITQVGEGTSEDALGPSGGSSPNRAKITVTFEQFNERRGVSTSEIMQNIRNAMEKYPGVQITVDKEQNGPPVGKPINIEISGEDYEELIALTERVSTAISQSGIEGIEELKSDLEVGKPELLFEIDRDKARRFGVSTLTIASALRTALFGKEVSKFKEGEDEYPIQLRLKEDQRYDVNALMNKQIIFRDNSGNLKKIPISAVSDLKYTSTYGSVKRKDLDRVISLYSNVNEGYNANEIVAQLKQVIADMDIPVGFDVKFTGEQEEQEETSAFLMKALLLAISMIFLIIVAQFNSLAAPFIIMTSVLFSTIGVFLGLFVFNMDFVIIMTGIGIISLAGVVVNNAIVLIDYTNLLRERKRNERGLKEGEYLSYADLVSTIIEGGKHRLRPVLLTAITTVLGLVPMATGMNINFFTLLSHFDPEYYAGGDNADFWGPMAWTVIFGLTFATFLTLILVPVMYLLSDILSAKVSGRKLEKDYTE